MSFLMPKAPSMPPPPPPPEPPPAPPPPPPPPSATTRRDTEHLSTVEPGTPRKDDVTEDPKTKEVVKKERERIAKNARRKTTMLTTPRGLLDDDAPTFRPSLIGGRKKI